MKGPLADKVAEKPDESSKDAERPERLPRVAQKLVTHEDLKSKFPLPKIPEWLERCALNLG